MSFERLNHKKVALVIPLSQESTVVVRGTARLEEDDEGVDVLRVQPTDSSGSPTEDSSILVKMHPYPPSIEQGGEFECDYSIRLTPRPAHPCDEPGDPRG